MCASVTASWAGLIGVNAILILPHPMPSLTLTQPIQTLPHYPDRPIESSLWCGSVCDRAICNALPLGSSRDTADDRDAWLAGVSDSDPNERDPNERDQDARDPNERDPDERGPNKNARCSISWK